MELVCQRISPGKSLWKRKKTVHPFPSVSRLNRWTGDDLARIAALTGGQLAFLFPDGNRVIIRNEEEEKSEPEEQMVRDLVEEFGEKE